MSGSPKGLDALLGGIVPSGGADDEDSPEPLTPEEHEEQLDDTVRELMASLKANDVKGFRFALESFVDLKANPPAAPPEAEDSDVDLEDEPSDTDDHDDDGFPLR